MPRFTMANDDKIGQTIYDLDSSLVRPLRPKKIRSVDELEIGTDLVVYGIGKHAYGRGRVLGVANAMFAGRSLVKMDFGAELGGVVEVEHNTADKLEIYDPHPDDPLC